jgi:type I restriction enzyme, R subunit
VKGACARTNAIARHFTDFMKKTDRFAKTIVFCVDQELASEVREALGNLNSDLRAQYPDYVAHVTSEEGRPGAAKLRSLNTTLRQPETLPAGNRSAQTKSDLSRSYESTPGRGR